MVPTVPGRRTGTMIGLAVFIGIRLLVLTRVVTLPVCVSSALMTRLLGMALTIPFPTKTRFPLPFEVMLRLVLWVLFGLPMTYFTMVM